MAEVFPYKVWNYDRILKKSITATSLQELIEKGSSKLGLTPTTQLRVVLEENGTVVDDEEFFFFLPGNTTFMFLQNKDRWRPSEIEAESRETDASSTASVDENLARLIARLRWELATILLFSPDQLQDLVDLDISQLAKFLERSEDYAHRVQEQCQHHLDEMAKMNDDIAVVKWYHRAISSNEQTHGEKVEGASKFEELGLRVTDGAV